MGSPEIVTTRSEDGTFALGATLGATLEPGTFVLLHGDLGAGKTAFVRGMVVGLGGNMDDVSSPTFVLKTGAEVKLEKETQASPSHGPTRSP